jgi:hypothetical protein
MGTEQPMRIDNDERKITQALGKMKVLSFTRDSIAKCAGSWKIAQ